MVVVETRRLRLREFRQDDFAVLHGFVSDPQVCRYTDWGPNEPADTMAFLAGAGRESRATPRHRYSLALVLKAENRLVGSGAVWVDSEQHRRGGLGFVVDRICWGQGFATEAAEQLVVLGFEALGLERLEATCRPANVGSSTVLERVGFQREGLLRDHLVIRGQRQDSLLYVLLRNR